MAPGWLKRELKTNIVLLLWFFFFGYLLNFFLGFITFDKNTHCKQMQLLWQGQQGQRIFRSSCHLLLGQHLQLQEMLCHQESKANIVLE